MSALTVSDAKEDARAQRLAALGIRRQDVEERFVHSGGHGGQNVNKTSTCVMLRHLPTGLEVKCQATRQQGRNRVLAWDLLLDKLEARHQSRLAQARARLEKARRRNRPRSRGAKARMLADKARHGAKKAARQSRPDF